MNKTFASLGCLVILLVLVLLLGMGGCVSYNGLVQKREAVNEKWAEVQSAYQRRLDLIPNLESTVKGQANFEQSTLTAIATARASVNQIKLAPGETPDQATMKQFQQSQGQLGSALGRLMMTSEAYPQLRANEGFMKLSDELAGTENRIAVARDRFNETAKDFNTTVESMPAALYAGIMGFHPKPYFESDAAASQAPKVDFGAKK
jgi:LemA protein